MHFPASIPAEQRRHLDVVVATATPTYTEGTDVPRAALEIRCLLATSRLVRTYWPDVAAALESDACARSQTLGAANPEADLPAQFLDEPALTYAFDQGQRQKLLERARSAPTAIYDDGPLYVAEMLVRGTVYRNEYDEHSGLAFYTSPETEDAVNLALRFGLDEVASRLHIVLGTGTDLPAAMREAEVLRSRLLEAEDARGGDISEGWFCTSDVVLLDQHGQLLQRLDCKGWITPVPPPQWQPLLDSAAALQSEAAAEDRWDNFCTAQGLRARAWAIKEIVAVSERLTHAIKVPIPATTVSAS